MNYEKSQFLIVTTVCFVCMTTQKQRPLLTGSRCSEVILPFKVNNMTSKWRSL
jgi:hypothetical protein